MDGVGAPAEFEVAERDVQYERVEQGEVQERGHQGCLASLLVTPVPLFTCIVASNYYYFTFTINS